MEEVKALDASLRPQIETILDGNSKLVIPILQRQLQNSPNLTVLRFLLKSSSEVIRRLAFESIICAQMDIPESFFIDEILPLLQEKLLIEPVIVSEMADFLAARRLGLELDMDFVHSKDMQEAIAFYILEKYYDVLKSAEPGTHHFCILKELGEFMQARNFTEIQLYLSQKITYESGVLFVFFESALEQQASLDFHTVANILHYSLCHCRPQLLQAALPIVDSPSDLIIEFENSLAGIDEGNFELSRLASLLMAINSEENDILLPADIQESYRKLSIANKIRLMRRLKSTEIEEQHLDGLFADVAEYNTHINDFDGDSLDKTSALAIITYFGASDSVLDLHQLQSLFEMTMKYSFSAYEQSGINAILLREAAKSPDFLALEEFRSAYRQMMSFAVANPHLSEFLLACEAFEQAELVIAAILAVPGPNLDPQAFELQTLHVLSNRDGAGTNAGVRMHLLTHISQIDHGSQIVDEILALEKNTESLLYTAGEPRLFAFSAAPRWSSDRQLRRQIELLKVLRRLVITHKYANIETATDLLVLLNDQKWQRSSRTAWEQIISLIYINAGEPFMGLVEMSPEQEKAVALESMVMITGQVALGVELSSAALRAIWGVILRYCMCGYAVVRLLARHALQRIGEKYDEVPESILDAAKSTIDEQPLHFAKIFDELPEIPVQADIGDVYFPYERPAIEIFANPRFDEDLEDIMSHAQFVMDPRALDNLRKRLRFLERSILGVDDPEEEKIEVESIEREFNVRVVASLLDNNVNLGGICRTCEVFGAKELFVASCADIEQQTFKNAAVTAEDHLDISFCPRDIVVSEIRRWKEEGWSIVALEQCSTSISIELFKFPDKCCIILGNETFGLPDDILLECDFFVEIPQFGVIRSLNVHVSCAIAVWEFVKQHK